MLDRDLKKKRATAFVLYGLVMVFPHVFLLIGILTSPSYLAFIIPLYLIVSSIMTGYLFYYLHNIMSYYIHLIVKVSDDFKSCDWDTKISIKTLKLGFRQDVYYRYHKYALPKAFIKAFESEHVILHQPLKTIHPTNQYHLKALSKPYDYALIKDFDQNLYVISLKHLSLYKEKAKS